MSASLKVGFHHNGQISPKIHLHFLVRLLSPCTKGHPCTWPRQLVFL